MWLGQSGSLVQITPTTERSYLLPLFNNNVRGVDALAAGDDGAIWFSESYGGLGRLTTRGTFTDHLVPAARSSPFSVVAAPDGSIWFADPGSDKIGRYF
jgi:streptogramin lyase